MKTARCLCCGEILKEEENLYHANFLFFMRKQFSVKPPRSPFIADLQCGLASFFSKP